ncbi:hypothetical protein [Streptomyces sp. NPDC050355]|uniref:hypothetical protein n=1 Tax=Streptomyces sp. NPDC050355 TaxID=3365609 RepID=UPI0037975D14
MNRERIQENYARQLARIEGSKVYSDHAKRVMAAKVYKQAQDALNQLRDAEVSQLRTRRSSLQRRMFGAHGDQDPNTVVARRDANDRAGKLEDPREAKAALQRAEMEGDATMAQAIATRAAQNGWGDVLADYTATRPGFTAAAEEFNSLPDPDDWQWKFAHTGQFLAGPPSVLSNASPQEIERLAQQDMEAPAADSVAGRFPTTLPGDAA